MRQVISLKVSRDQLVGDPALGIAGGRLQPVSHDASVLQVSVDIPA